MSERPRVLLVNYEFPPIGGGAGTATAGLARALATLGCDVVVLTSRFGDLPALERMHGYTVRRVRVVRRYADRCTPPEMATFMISAGFSALRLTQRWRPDLTIAFFGIPSGPVAWLVRAVRGAPYVVSLRGGDVPGFDCAPGITRYHRLSLPLLRFLWRRAIAVVANGTGLRELALRAVPGINVALIPNGVDTELHAPAAVPRTNETPRILLVGRLAYQKAVDVLIRALARMREQAFSCEIVGDGPDRAALVQLARSAGLEERVHFAGWVTRDALQRHYQHADIVVLPSRMEGMPNVVLEAMAHALPVVATDVPGTRELVRSDTGVLVPVEDDAALAAALTRLLHDGASRKQLGAAARARALAEFTWSATATAYLRHAGITVTPGPRAVLPSTAGVH